MIFAKKCDVKLGKFPDLIGQKHGKKLRVFSLFFFFLLWRFSQNFFLFLFLFFLCDFFQNPKKRKKKKTQFEETQRKRILKKISGRERQKFVRYSLMKMQKKKVKSECIFYSFFYKFYQFYFLYFLNFFYKFFFSFFCVKIVGNFELSKIKSVFFYHQKKFSGFIKQKRN